MSGVAELVRRLNSMGYVPKRVADDGAKVIDGLLKEQFDAGKDPYGRAWAPRKSDGGTAGTETGKLKKGTKAKGLARGGGAIKVTVSKDYGRYFSDGTKTQPARPILPEKGRMPPAWHEALQETFRKEIARTWKGRR